MKTHKQFQERLRHISPLQARLLQLFGPAESWDNPLTGTKYDSGVHRHEEDARRHAKLDRRAARRREHELHSLPDEPETDHHTPDEV